MEDQLPTHIIANEQVAHQTIAKEDDGSNNFSENPTDLDQRIEPIAIPPMDPGPTAPLADLSDAFSTWANQQLAQPEIQASTDLITIPEPESNLLPVDISPSRTTSARRRSSSGWRRRLQHREGQGDNTDTQDLASSRPISRAESKESVTLLVDSSLNGKPSQSMQVLQDLRIPEEAAAADNEEPSPGQSDQIIHPVQNVQLNEIDGVNAAIEPENSRAVASATEAITEPSHSLYTSEIQPVYQDKPESNMINESEHKSDRASSAARPMSKPKSARPITVQVRRSAPPNRNTGNVLISRGLYVKENEITKQEAKGAKGEKQQVPEKSTVSCAVVGRNTIGPNIIMPKLAPRPLATHLKRRFRQIAHVHSEQYANIVSATACHFLLPTPLSTLSPENHKEPGVNTTTPLSTLPGVHENPAHLTGARYELRYQRERALYQSNLPQRPRTACASPSATMRGLISAEVSHILSGTRPLPKGIALPAKSAQDASESIIGRNFMTGKASTINTAHSKKYPASLITRSEVTAEQSQLNFTFSPSLKTRYEQAPAVASQPHPIVRGPWHRVRTNHSVAPFLKSPERMGFRELMHKYLDSEGVGATQTLE